MASSQPPTATIKHPQPRGLPGFLRRTFQNSYEQEINILDSPLSVHETPALPNNPYAASVDNVTPGSSSEGELDLGVRSKSVPCVAVDDQLSNSGKTAIKEEGVNSTGNRYVRTSSVGNVKKHLRAVAFPPLPDEQEGDDSDGYPGAIENARPVSALAHPPATPKTDLQTNTSKPRKKSFRETKFDAMLASPIIPLRDLRKLAWNGIPPHHRPLTWKILLGYIPANTARHETTLQRRRREYKDAIKQHYDIPDDARTNSEQETLRQVLVDVPRTAPEVPLFHNDRVRRGLSRLLYVWAMRHPASSYVQGINDLATPLMSVFLSGYFGGRDCLDGEVMADVTDQMLEEVEADTYWCLTSLLAGIQDHYTSDQPGMQRMVMHLEELVNRIDADLATHLRNTGIEFLQFAFKWMNCLLLREFQLSRVMRLWDTYLSEGDGGFEDFHVYVCASFMVHFSHELQQMSFDELFQFMQNIPTNEWEDREIEVLLSSAFVLSTLFGDSEAHLNVVRQNI